MSEEMRIGNTRLIRLFGIERVFGAQCRLFAKAEYENPSGSVKDRAAFYMINDAEKRGLISKGDCIVEATSGNLGISLSYLALRLGYSSVIVMPDSSGAERKKIITELGGRVIEVSGGMSEAERVAEEYAKKHKNCFTPCQFTNKQNALAHYFTTAPEIYSDIKGEIDAFVVGVGSGGTVSGVGRYLKEREPSVRIVAVEPEGSRVLSGGAPSPHKIVGIGANFLPPLFDRLLVDEIIAVGDDEAMAFTMALARCERIFVGISSGAVLCAALKLVRSYSLRDKSIVMLFADGADRYFFHKNVDKV